MYQHCDTNTIAGWSSCYDCFYNNIPTSQLKPYHFDPALSDGNIEQIYGKLCPRAVHHTSVMAPAFKIGVWVRVGESFMGSFTEKVKGYLTLDSFLSEGNITRVASWAWIVVIHDIARFNAISRMLRSLFLRQFCSPGSSRLVCRCKGEGKLESLIFMTQWGDLAAIFLRAHM